MPSDFDEAPWYRPRSYAHFDRRPSKARALAHATDPIAVARHGFFPFIMRPIRVCHYETNSEGKRVHKHKIRPVSYAAHMDTHIHAYYAWTPNKLLENSLAAPFGSSVLAYRKHNPARSNVEFALEAFDEVTQRGEADVLAIDVEGFFDSLNHELLKSAWARLLGTNRLPSDHYAVFRSVTTDSAVLWSALRKALGEVYRRRSGRTGAPICSPAEFRSSLAPLAESRHRLVWKVKGKSPPPHIAPGVPAGIPQGSALSAILANLYMLDVDRELYGALASIGASYRRYSDDILVVAPTGKLQSVEALLEAALSRVRLSINSRKTERIEFRLSQGRATPTFIDSDGRRFHQRPMQYLGLTFNGEVARMRDGTVSRFLIRMARAVRQGRRAASNAGVYRLKRRKLYAAFSRLGAGRAYGPWKVAKGQVPHPGFMQYALRADRAADARSAIGSQCSRAWHRLHTRIASEQAKLDPCSDP